MDLLGITTTQAVRAALGISEASGELDDAVFSALALEDLLELELTGWLPVPLLSPRLSERMLAAALSGAATYWCAAQMMQSAELGFAIKHEDGQNAFTRQGDGYEAPLARMRQQYERYRAAVLAALQSATASVPTFFGKAAPSYDPVTGV